jgi:hypothetical protein
MDQREARSSRQIETAGSYRSGFRGPGGLGALYDRPADEPGTVGLRPSILGATVSMRILLSSGRGRRSHSIPSYNLVGMANRGSKAPHK